MNAHKLNLKLQIITNTLCENLGLPHIKVKVMTKNNNDCYGEYFYNSGVVAIYPTVRNKEQSMDSIMDTMCHEVAHHYQYYFQKNLQHNKDFFKTLKLIQRTVN